VSEVSTKALLRIHIADVDGVVAKNRTVIIKRVNITLMKIVLPGAIMMFVKKVKAGLNSTFTMTT
jgi:hypothetical protein